MTCGPLGLTVVCLPHGCFFELHTRPPSCGLCDSVVAAKRRAQPPRLQGQCCAPDPELLLREPSSPHPWALL